MDKFVCLCGSEVKEANKKAHEKTKKHLNFQQSNALNNAMKVHNLNIPPKMNSKMNKKKQVQYNEEEEDDEYHDDDNEDEEDDENADDELFQVVEMLYKKVDDLHNDFKMYSKQHTDLILSKMLDLIMPITERLGKIEKCLTDRLPYPSGSSESPWINDKCTPRN